MKSVLSRRDIEFAGITKYLKDKFTVRVETNRATLKFVLTTSVNVVPVPTECVTLEHHYYCGVNKKKKIVSNYYG